MSGIGHNSHCIIDRPWVKPLDLTDRYVEVNRLGWEMVDTLGVPVGS